MKKILISTLLLVLLVYPARSQNRPANEFGVSYGTITVPDVAMTFGSILGVAFSGGLWSFDNINATGAFGLEYYHNFNDRIAVGGICCYDAFMADAIDEDGGQKINKGRYGSHFINVMPAFRVNWFDRERVSMYSKIAAGAMLQISPDDELGENTTDWAFAAHLSLAGVEFGSRTFRGFVEAGWGMQGILTFGVKKAF